MYNKKQLVLGVAVALFTLSLFIPSLVQKGRMLLGKRAPITNFVDLEYTVTTPSTFTLYTTVRLTTHITHPFPGDLTLLLTSPGGDFYDVTFRHGGGRANAFDGTVWQDDYPLVDSYVFSGTGSVAQLGPTVPLADITVFEFDPLGTWILSVSDEYTSYDIGDAASFTLEFDNVDNCATNPCNPGSCTDSFQSHTCTCPTGYEGTGGTSCTLINNCASSPCFNGGTCFNGVNSFSCGCAGGFSGSQCQTKTCSGNSCTISALSLGTDSVSAQLVFSDSSIVLGSTTHMSLTLDVTHPFPEELQITLTSPASTVITLVSKGTKDFSATFEGTTFENLFDETAYSFSGTTTATQLRPMQSFSAFSTQNVAGTWTLTITDTYLTDNQGTLNGWGLTFSAPTFCSSNPCSNGGTCINTPTTHVCKCPTAFTGATCGTAQTTLAQIIVGSTPIHYWRFQRYPNAYSDIGSSNKPFDSTRTIPAKEMSRVDYASNTALFIRPYSLLPTAATLTFPLDYSVEVVFKMLSFPPSNANVFFVASTNLGTNPKFRVQVTNIGKVVVRGSSTTYTTSSNQLTTGQLAHVVFTKSGSTMTLYLNNVVVSNTVAHQDFASVFAIAGGGFHGYVDEVAIYNSVLGASAVSTRYTKLTSG